MDTESERLNAQQAFFALVYESTEGEPTTESELALIYVATRMLGFAESAIYFDEMYNTETGQLFRYYGLEPRTDRGKYNDDQLVTIIDEIPIMNSSHKLAAARMLRSPTKQARIVSDILVNDPNPEIKSRAYETLLELGEQAVNNMLPSHNSYQPRIFVANLWRAYSYILVNAGDQTTRDELDEPLLKLMQRVEVLFPDAISQAVKNLRDGGDYRGDAMTPDGSYSRIYTRKVNTIDTGEDYPL